jgi:hypothetical protein
MWDKVEISFWNTLLILRIIRRNKAMKKEWDRACKKLHTYASDRYSSLRLESNKYTSSTSIVLVEYDAYIEYVGFSTGFPTAMQAVDDIIRIDKENKEKENG